MKSKFIVLNKRNGGCPICQGTDGDCRQSDDDRNPLYLCHPSRGDIPGFNFIGETSDGLWGKYFIDRGDDWKREPRNNRVIDWQPKATKTETINTLSAEQRHQYYSEIFSQLTLNDKDKSDLIRRGLSEQDIKDGCFVSINQFTRLNKNYPNLPGINGNRFITAGEGYVVPIRDINRLFVGHQIRLYTTEGKYRWAKDCHTLEYSELPLQHCINNPDDPWVNLAEGTLKPFIGAKRLNTNAIGASGGQFVSSQQTLINSINQLKDQFSFRIVPDAGSKANQSVLNQYRRTNKLLASLGQTLWVLDYGQGFDKSKSDFDELESTPTNARTIPYTDWDVLAWLDLPSEDDLNNDDPDNWKTQQAIRSHYAWKNSKKFTPDITIDVDKCPAGLLVDYKDKSKSIGFPGYRQGIALKLHTGQGKTTRIIQELCTTYSGKEAIYGNHRNSLGEQFVNDVDNYIDNNGGNNGDRFYMLNNINDTHYPRLVLAFDSLIKFKPTDFDDKVLIFDEVESSLRHITGGGTIREGQKEVMALFEEASKRCHSIILADANLSDRTCEFIEKISGIKITKVGNKRLPQRPKVYLYDETKGNPKYLIGLAYKEPFPWIMTDANIDSKTICRDALLNYGKKYLEINADTISDSENPDRQKWIRAFLENPSIVDLPGFPYDGVVSSPTIESGVSCTSKRFSKVFMFIKHLESLFSSQMIMRERDIDCPRYISIKDFCLNSEYDSSLNSPYEKQLAKNHLEALAMAQELFISGKIGREKLIDVMTQLVTSQQDDPWTNLYFYHKSITNYEKQNLKACALEVLQEHGFDIEIISELPSDAPSINYTKVKSTVKLEDSEAVYNASEISPEQYDRYSRRTDLNPKEKASVEKFKILSQLPGIKDDKDNWSVSLVHHIKYEKPLSIKQAELRTLCTIEELAKLRSAKSWEKVLNNHKFLGKFKDNHLVVRTLIKKDILNLLTSLVDREYTKDTPAVMNLYNDWTRKDAIATRIDRGASPTTLIKRLAFKLGFIASEIGRDENTRTYTLTDELRDGYGAIILDHVKIDLGQELTRRQNHEAQNNQDYCQDYCQNLDQNTSGLYQDRLQENSIVYPQQLTVPNPPNLDSDSGPANTEFYIYITNQNKKNICHPHYGQDNIIKIDQPVNVPLESLGQPVYVQDNIIKIGQEELKEFIEDNLNDYLLDQGCDRMMGKKVKQGMELLSDAVTYCWNRTGIAIEQIETIARELALANELIGLVPADIALKPAG